MEVEKRGMKGGFSQLFDWNSKSRKKLFSSKSSTPESSNSGKENYQSTLIGRDQLEVEKGFLPKAEGEDSYHYAGPSNGDPEYGKKAPGVVARLMGLDSLPNSSVNESFPSPFLGPHIFRDPGYLMSPPVLPGEHDIVIFESVRNKLDRLKQNPSELGSKKAPTRPVERFQTEGVPPKSAKPVSLNHNRLLSPIKSPGFVPPKNAAYVIEAASKMIEQSSRSTFKGTVPSVGSSVTLRNWDLRERMEAVEKSSRIVGMPSEAKEPSSVKNVRNQIHSNVQERSDDYFRSSEECRGIGSQRSRVKEKVDSPAVQQAKMNIQRRNGSVSVSSRSFGKQKEHNDAKLASSSRNITDPPKRVKRHTSPRGSEALRLNNQKQNRASVEGNDNFESPFCHPKMRKESNPSTSNAQERTNRTLDKIVVSNIITSGKINIVEPDSRKESSPVISKNSCKKKLPASGNIQINGTADEKATRKKAVNSSKYNASEGNSEWDGIEKKKTLDVVSFTFTSPIKKSGAGSSLHDTSVASDNLALTDLSLSAASSSGINATAGGDAPSALLDKKLRELTSCVSCSQDQSRFSGPTCSSGDGVSSPSSVNFMQKDNNTCINKREISSYSADSPSNSNLWSNDLEMLECSDANGHGINMEYGMPLTSQASPSLSSKPSFYGGASDSFEVDESSLEGQYSCLSYASHEETNWSSTRKPQLAEGDYEVVDTASSVSVGTLSENTTSSTYMMNPKDSSSNWQLLYIGDILENAEILSDELALKQQAEKLIHSNMFHQLENQKKHLYCDTEELERRVLFDCVFGWLEGKTGVLLERSFRVWAKQMGMLQQRQLLAKEVYREILSWTNDEEKMVDELVDRDMSSGEGKWIDFEGETFEEGLEIEETIATCLVNELIEDLF